MTPQPAPLSFSPAAVAEIARRLLGTPNRHLSTSRELRFGSRGSVSVIPARGVFFDHESGMSGGVLDLVTFAGAAPDRRGAVELLQRGGDLPQPETDAERATRKLGEAQDRLRRVTAAGAIWKAAQPISGSLAETYLRQARGLSAPLHPNWLRFAANAPVHPYSEDSRTRPALVAAILSATGRLQGAHLTYLRSDGLGKAAITPARKMVGLAAGGRVHLLDGGRIVVGEGLESTLSAWAAVLKLDPSARLGACAALSAGGMARLDLPAHARSLVIAFDRDASGTGEAAARTLAKRASAEGRPVDLLPPPDGFGDWNQVEKAGAL